jgi:hypothetical protein
MGDLTLSLSLAVRTVAHVGWVSSGSSHGAWLGGAWLSPWCGRFGIPRASSTGARRRLGLERLEVDDPGSPSFPGDLARSDHPFDAWFRSGIEDVQPVDFSAPPPAPTRVL